jgi:LrgB-like family
VTASTLLVRAFRIASPFKYLSRKRDEDIARTDDAEQIAQHVNREFQLETEGNDQQVEEIELNRIVTKTDSSLHSSISDLHVGPPPSVYSLPNNDDLNATDTPPETVDNRSEALSSTQGVLEQQPSRSKWERTKSYILQRLTIAHVVYITMLVVSFIIYLPISTSSPIYLPILLPLYLSMSILAYYLALQVPERIRFFLHPIISASAIVMLGMEVTEVIKGGNLLTGLSKYSTGARYLNLLEGTSQGHIPGAGDVLFSLLDCSIISLSTVMFRYRKELKKHVSEG